LPDGSCWPPGPPQAPRAAASSATRTIGRGERARGCMVEGRAGGAKRRLTLGCAFRGAPRRARARTRPAPARARTRRGRSSLVTSLIVAVANVPAMRRRSAGTGGPASYRHDAGPGAGPARTLGGAGTAGPHALRALLVTALAAAIAMSGTADAQPGDAACGGPLVNTSSGPLCGLEVPAYDGADVTVQAFLGVPYAETTAGANRWRPPVPRPPWTAPLLAHDHGPPCPQAADELLPQRDEPSEDCLRLIVWTPAADGAGRPVIVYLYGGAFVNGSTVALLYEDGPLVYDGARLAATQDVVVVTLNF